MLPPGEKSHDGMKFCCCEAPGVTFPDLIPKSLGVNRATHHVLPVPWSECLPIKLPADLSQVTLKRHRGEFSRQTILATREWPMDLLMEDVLPIRVSALRFMQTSAACRFQDGRSMEDLVIDIISGQTRPWELPPVELVGDVDLIESPRQQQDLPLVWTRDHRRVWSLQAALAILRERIPGLEVLVPAKVRSQHDPKEMQDIARKFKTTSRHKNSGVRLALEGALQDLCREFGLVVTTLEMLERGLSARLCLSTQLYKSCFWVEMPLRMQELLH